MTPGGAGRPREGKAGWTRVLHPPWRAAWLRGPPSHPDPCLLSTRNLVGTLNARPSHLTAPESNSLVDPALGCREPSCQPSPTGKCLLLPWPGHNGADGVIGATSSPARAKVTGLQLVRGGTVGHSSVGAGRVASNYCRLASQARGPGRLYGWEKWAEAVCAL